MNDVPRDLRLIQYSTNYVATERPGYLLLLYVG